MEYTKNSARRASMDGIWFVCIHLWGTALLWYLYTTYLANAVYLYHPKQLGFSLEPGTWRILLLVLPLVGLILTSETHRGWTRAAFNLLAPYGLFFLLQWNVRNWPMPISFLLLFGLVYAAISGVCTMLSSWSVSLSFLQRLWLKLKFWAEESVGVFFGCFACVAVLFACSVATPFADLTIQDSEMQAIQVSKPTTAPIPTPTQESIPEATPNLVDVPALTEAEAVAILRSDARQSMTEAAYRDVLQAIANLEQAHLGYPVPCTVQLVDFPAHTLGQYWPDEHVVALNRSYITSASTEEVLLDILHECHHAFQHAHCDLLNLLPEEYHNLITLHPALIYDEALDNYVQPEEDYDQYYNNPAEIASRTYAENRISAYLSATQG